MFKKKTMFENDQNFKKVQEVLDSKRRFKKVHECSIMFNNVQ